jgi:hypothetical protein
VITRECYARHVRPFVTEVGGDTAKVVNLSDVSAQRVRPYVTDLGGRYSPQSLKLIATAIRSRCAASAAASPPPCRCRGRRSTPGQPGGPARCGLISVPAAQPHFHVA